MSMTEQELKDRLDRSLSVVETVARLTPTKIDDEACKVLRAIVDSPEAIGGLWEILRKVGAICLLAVAVLALTPAARAQRPRVGEEVRDAQGNLLWSSPPSCSLCGPDCQCGPGCRCDDSHVRYRSAVERKAFLIWIWGRGRRDQDRPPTTDPAVLQALGQLQQNQQRLIELLAQLQARGDRQPVQPPAPQIILIPQGQPYQSLPVEPRPRQDLPVEPRPRQDLPVEPRPRQDLPTEPKPRQDLPSDPRPRQDLPLSPGPRQNLDGLGKPTPPAGGAKPFSPSPGEARPPAGYQTYTRYPVQRAIYPVDGRR